MPFETLSFTFDHAVMFRQSCLRLANHLWVCDQCLSAIAGLFICDIVPACWAHSHSYVFDTIVVLLAAILYNISSHNLSLACCSEGTEPGISPAVTALSCPVCVMLLITSNKLANYYSNTPHFWEKLNLSNSQNMMFLARGIQLYMVHLNMYKYICA